MIVLWLELKKNTAVPCGENEVYELRAECTKTCLDTELAECGLKVPIEGCYCKTGFVKNNADKCIPVNECGCKTPDMTSIIDVKT